MIPVLLLKFLEIGMVTKAIDLKVADRKNMPLIRASEQSITPIKLVSY